MSKSDPPEEWDDAEQAERFVEAARELGSDEDGKAFEAATAAIFIAPLDIAVDQDRKK